jgi:hypothetical protein
VLYSTELDGELYDVVQGDEQATTLAALALPVGERFRYEYDFGDGWVHDIVIEKIDDATTPARPVCLAGRRACPPEDCGGPWGYAHLLDVLADPDHEEHEHLCEWVGLPHSRGVGIGQRRGPRGVGCVPGAV